MSLEFTLCLISLFLFAGIGMPVAYAILLASLVYLFLGGQSIGIAGKIMKSGGRTTTMAGSAATHAKIAPKAVNAI